MTFLPLIGKLFVLCSVEATPVHARYRSSLSEICDLKGDFLQILNMLTSIVRRNQSGLINVCVRTG